MQTFTIQIPDDRLPGIELARDNYNATLPSGEPHLDTATYVQFMMADYVKSWCTELGVPLADEEAPPPEFMALTPKQLRLGLIAAAILPEQVEDMINAIANVTERSIARVQWEYTTQYDRNHPLVLQLAAGFNLTSEQVDSMWHAAELL